MKFTSRGFTLVELMIVIAIIGILAAALFPSLTAYLKRSRDAGRSANLNTIQTAVGAHYSDRESYPIGTASGCVQGTTIDTTSYFPKGVPTDPSADVAQSLCHYTASSKAMYAYGSTPSGTGFVISALMENANGGNAKVTVATGAVILGAAITLVSTDIEKGTGSVFVLVN